MKKFIVRFGVFSLILSGVITSAFLLGEGLVDPFYSRFTTPRQANLIIGSSRAAQGLQPRIMNEILGNPIYNYAFTLTHSPFGPTYFESIKKKLIPNEQKGLFIIELSPWSLTSRADDPNDSKAFKELNYCLNTTTSVNENPNLDYIIENRTGSRFFVENIISSMYLHEDGWLEVSVNMNQSFLNLRVKSKLKKYRNSLKRDKFSSFRLESLSRLVKYLKNRGDVYLVRLPVYSKMLEIEDELMSDFEERIYEVIEQSDGYLDLSRRNEEFEFSDGSHLYKDSGKEVSEIIARWIIDKENGLTL